MELLKKIGKLKKSEKRILNDIYWTMAYASMLIIILLLISFGSGGNPAIAMLISIIIVIIYTVIIIYLIGLAVAFGTIRAKREFLKAEIDVKEEEKQEVKEGEVDE
jgi:hypothetical protein